MLVGASIALGVVLHPLQFGMVQLLEGYWGVGVWQQRLRAWAIQRHRRRREALLAAAGTANRAFKRADLIPEERRRERETVANLSVQHEADRLFNQYPILPHEVMPTRLGNMLRRYETAPGRPIGADLPALVPLLAAVAPPEQIDYVNDQRSALDLAVRTVMLSFAATLFSVLLLWNDGLWLLVALLPYLATYLSYRGCVICAESYGSALGTLLMLNRFRLYEQLHLALPANMYQELRSNKLLTAVFRHFEVPEPRKSMKYQHPPTEPSQT